MDFIINGILIETETGSNVYFDTLMIKYGELFKKIYESRNNEKGEN